MVKIIRKSKQGVAPVGRNRTTQQTTGFGYVIIPEGVDRNKYVDGCFRRNRLPIIDDADGNIIHDCYVSKEVLANVEFPLEVGEKGVPVVWVAQPFQNIPMIVGTLSSYDSVTIRSDAEINYSKTWEKGEVTIKGNARDGSLTLLVRGQEFSRIKIAAFGSEDSVCEVFSNGSIDVTANKDVTIKAFQNLVGNVTDSETGNSSGFSVNKESFITEANYGEGDDKNFAKTQITEEGRVTEIKAGESTYRQTVNESMDETTFQDCTVKAEKGKLTISQGNAVIEISGGKLAITNDGTGLNELLTKIVDAIATLTVSTAVGPSGTPLPPTIQKTTELTNLLKQFFNK